jgi:glycosyltransferase involved in cell wall biosynthesis
LFGRAAGIFAISNLIENRYTARGVPVLRVPSLFDFSEATSLAPASAKNGEFVLLYAGSCKVTDNCYEMLEGFRLASQRNQRVRLVIIGASGSAPMARLVLARVNQDPILKQGVEFLGRVPDEQYLAQVASANALFLLRSSGVRSEASFPTRLPEFLATQRPVITSKVPDIPLYLQDHCHAHVVPPGRPDLICERICDMVAKPDAARRLGETGRERGVQCFDLSRHAQRMASFIQEPNPC